MATAGLGAAAWVSTTARRVKTAKETRSARWLGASSGSLARRSSRPMSDPRSGKSGAGLSQAFIRLKLAPLQRDRAAGSGGELDLPAQAIGGQQHDDRPVEAALPLTPIEGRRRGTSATAPGSAEHSPPAPQPAPAAPRARPDRSRIRAHDWHRAQNKSARQSRLALVQLDHEDNRPPDAALTCRRSHPSPRTAARPRPCR